MDAEPPPLIDTGLELAALEPAGLERELRGRLGAAAGAVVSFTGVVRERTAAGELIRRLVIEHYPGMTERKLAAAAAAAAAKWKLAGISLRHRHGTLRAGEVIVHLAVASAHRREAYAASAAIVDWLKTDVPLWKKELGDFGERWVEPAAGEGRSRGLAG